MTKKLRSDAWEGALTDELKSRVYLAAGTARNFHEAKLIIKRDFPDVRVPGERAWYRFLDRMRNNAAMLLQRAAAAARDVKTMAKTTKFDRVDLINSFQTLAAEAEFAGDHDRAKALFDTVFKLAHIDQREEELKLAAKRIKMFEEREAALRKVVDGAKKKGGLTKETLAKIEEAAGLL